jgi:purine-nucleoside phosphorylase
VALVLGSGLGVLADGMEVMHSWAFAELPFLVPTSIHGHGGRLLNGVWAGRPVLVYSGRVHYYEGNGWDAATAPVRLAAALGVKEVLLTNAAGGIREDLVIGSLMVLIHHVKWTEPYCWRRGINRSDPMWYSDRLNTRLFQVAADQGVTLSQGIYAQLTGPCYETPAEIRALKALGVDAVGMSTAREAEAAVAAGVECAAISCVTNRAAGLSAAPLNHEEVLAHSKEAAGRLGQVIRSFLEA